MSADVTALPTVISSEIESLVGAGCGTVPVATERSTFELLKRSRPLDTQPERESTAVPTTQKAALRRSRPFV
jgi:hypothetical protein